MAGGNGTGPLGPGATEGPAREQPSTCGTRPGSLHPPGAGCREVLPEPYSRPS